MDQYNSRFCVWDKVPDSHVIIYATSCGGKWGESMAKRFTACPECDGTVSFDTTIPKYDQRTERRRTYKAPPITPPSVASMVPELMAKLQESLDQQEVTRQAMPSCCPVPQGCEGAHVSYFDGKLNSREGATFGTIPCPYYIFGDTGCDLGKRQYRKSEAGKKERAKQFCQHIMHMDFMDDDVILKARKNQAMSYMMANKDSKFVILSGGTGRGKDLAIALRCLNHDLQLGSMHWFHASDVVSDMSGQGKRLEHALEFKRGVVVIEDLGAEPEAGKYNQGDTAAMITHAMDKALGSGLFVYVSTNLSRSDIDKRYGARLRSRLNSAAFCAVSDNEPDMRELNAKEKHKNKKKVYE